MGQNIWSDGRVKTPEACRTVSVQAGCDPSFSRWGFLTLCTEGEVLIKCTGCSNLLTPWQGALQGTLAYQCRGWWTSLGTHQSEPHWFGTRHFQSSASISSWKASLKPDRGSWLYLSGRAWKSCQLVCFNEIKNKINNKQNNNINTCIYNAERMKTAKHNHCDNNSSQLPNFNITNNL